jgi:hypothetical protein
MTAKKERTILKYTKREFEKLLKDKLMSECNVTIDAASADQIYRCLAMITRQIMSDRQKQYQSKVLGEGKKQVYYLCMEFLMGRSLRTSLFNLGLNEVAESVLADADVKIDTIYEQEPDAGLGNGGLGRLAACYLDGMATDGIPGTGYSILYEYGSRRLLTTGCPAVRSGSRAIPTRPRRSALTARPSRPGRAASITSSMRTTTPLSPCPTICMSPVTAPTVFPSCVCGRLRPPALI